MDGQTNNDSIGWGSNTKEDYVHANVQNLKIMDNSYGNRDLPILVPD